MDRPAPTQAPTTPGGPLLAQVLSLLADVLSVPVAQVSPQTRFRDQGLDSLGAADAPIAIIGMGCRLPGGLDSPEALWQALLTGYNGVVEHTLF